MAIIFKSNRIACSINALALFVLGLSGCDYKAPPSPLFDEHERFGEQLEQRRQLRSDKANEGVRSSPAPNVFWPTPAPSPTPRSSQER